MTTRIGVLASGGGSNLQAIFDHLEQLGERRAGEVVLVASDRPSAGALLKARQRGVPALELASRVRPDAPTLDDVLERHRVDLVVLAGYLKLVPVSVVRRYHGRMLNVHPALLPAFGGEGMYGGRVHQAVLDAGARLSGVTVHFVDEQFDRGAIIAQWPVPVLAGDDASTLAARVLRVEHLLYPRVVNAAAAGHITLDGVRSRGALHGTAQSAFTLLDRDTSCLAEDIDRALSF